MSSRSIIRDVMIWDAEHADAVHGDVVISGNTIESVCAPRSADGDVIFDGHGRVAAIPGLVNAHTHIAMTLLRGLGEELPLMEWLTKRIFPIEDRLEAHHIRCASELALLEMLACGVTSFADMYFFEDEVAEAVLASGMRAALSRSIVNDEGRRLREAVDLAKRYNGREGRIVVQLAPHAPYTVPDAQLDQIMAASREHDLGIHFHWLETEGELKSFTDERKMAPIDYLRSNGLLDARELILAHVVWHPAESLADLARPNVVVAHNPKSNMKLASGFAPIKQMFDAGVNVALGTDGASSNNRLDVWDEMRTASLIHKGNMLDPTVISARDVLKMATVNGARGIGFKNVGLIKPGQRADLALVDISGPCYVGVDESTLPEFLVYAGSSRDVRATICDGRVLYQDGKFTTLDASKIISLARDYRREITAG